MEQLQLQDKGTQLYCQVVGVNALIGHTCWYTQEGNIWKAYSVFNSRYRISIWETIEDYLNNTKTENNFCIENIKTENETFHFTTRREKLWA